MKLNVDNYSIFDNFIVMQTNGSLEKKAIKLALNEEWSEAIEVNKTILEASPDNLNAKIRLGRAYLQLKDFEEAQKWFEEVLKIDPINKIAQKNIDLAKSKKASTPKGTRSNGKAIIKEPGTTQETTVTITAKGETCNGFSYGTTLDISEKNKKVLVSQDKTILGEIDDVSIAKRVLTGLSQNYKVSAAFLKGEDKVMKILIKSSDPIFKGDKQDIKPYLKKGSIEMPELEVESFDDE